MSSHEAGAACTEWIREHHTKIIKAIYSANRPMVYIDIAQACGLKPEQVARRLKELKLLGYIQALGPITLLVTGRKRSATYTLWNLTKSTREAIAEVN